MSIGLVLNFVLFGTRTFFYFYYYNGIYFINNGFVYILLKQGFPKLSPSLVDKINLLSEMSKCEGSILI